MKTLAAIRIALRALRVNRLRSALTMLGIVIGVAAVIAMVAVGAGATARIQQQIEAIGSNLIMVIPGSITSNGIRLGSGAVDPFRGRRPGYRGGVSFRFRGRTHRARRSAGD